jgi:hypothetical protein
MVESSSRVHRIQGCGATFALPTAGSPQIDGRTPALLARLAGPCQVQRDTVLDAVKAWPADDGTRVASTATAILDGVCARRHWGPRQVGTKKRPSGRTKKLTEPRKMKKHRSKNA